MANGVRITPVINCKGLFEVEKPFRLNPKKVYEVVAIREFADLWVEHVDVKELYYLRNGLSEDIYNRDVKLGAAIITLKGEDGIFYIPDTYIVKFPELGIADYHHAILSISLGAVPRRLNLDGVKAEIAQVVSKLLGVTPEVRVHVGETKDAITRQQAAKLEQIRLGNISVDNSHALKNRRLERERVEAIRAYNQEVQKKYPAKPKK